MLKENKEVISKSISPKSKVNHGIKQEKKLLNRINFTVTVDNSDYIYYRCNFALTIIEVFFM